MSTPSERDVRGRVPYAALAIGVCLVVATAIMARAGIEAFRIHHQDKRVTVTGSTTRRIKSDFTIWRVTIKNQAPELTAAYRKLSSDVPRLVEFIKKRGVEEKEIVTSSATIGELHARDKDGHEIPESTVAYNVEQSVEVSSFDIDKVEKASREVSELIEQGIFIESQAPLYIYTKLAELKIQMLADASKDARQRAEQIANNSGSRVTALLTARMGVMQINPAYSTEVSGEGNNDKSSREKDAMAIVTASFGLD